MSNRMKMISAITALVIIIGALTFFIFGSKKPQALKSPQPTQTQTQTQTSSVSPKSLKELMALSTNQSCTFTDENQNTGTIYSGNGKVRGDFASRSDDTTSLSHMMSDGTDFYVWTDGMKEGFKGNINDFSNMVGQNPNQTGQVMNPDQKFDYKCVSWNVDNSKFIIPANVTFRDMSEMMKALPSGTTQPGSQNGADMKAAQCKSCDSLAGEAQSQCKKVLSC